MTDGIVEDMTFDGERALYGLAHASVRGCRFEGPADGESALKEARDIDVEDCRFSLRYPLWHVKGFSLRGSTMAETCRAPLWYGSDGTIADTVLHGPKCLRECDRISIEGCDVVSPEFGWRCRDISMTGCGIESEYMFLDSRGLELTGCRIEGKYSFQYIEGAVLRNCTLSTKDAFWHSRGAVLIDCDVFGEYLGWYSEDLTLIGCRLSGTQPLCYCKGLKLVGCTMEGADLAFEYSDVDAEVLGHVDSVKNPRSGRIRAGSIGEVVLGDQVMECDCDIAAGAEGDDSSWKKSTECSPSGTATTLTRSTSSGRATSRC